MSPQSGPNPTVPEQTHRMENHRPEKRRQENYRPEPDTEPPTEDGPQPHHAELPMWLRVSLILTSFVLLVLGIAGLVLPGLQGILTIVFGLALLSLVSHQAHRFLHWSLGPWPNMRERVEGYRQRSFTWLNNKLGNASASALGAEEAAAQGMDVAEVAVPHLNLETRRVGSSESNES